MAIEFLNSAFGNDMQYGFLTALRGSWNTTDPNDFRGYKVIYGHLSSAQDTTVDYVADFCSGFLTDSVNRVYWGRPVGLATDKEGRIFISSDESSRVILILSPKQQSSVKSLKRDNGLNSTIYPNPVKNGFTLTVTLYRSTRVSVELFDLSGKKVQELMEQQTLSEGHHSLQLDVAGVKTGSYLIKVTSDNGTLTHKIIVTE
jgi:hypothetical protein